MDINTKRTAAETTLRTGTKIAARPPYIKSSVKLCTIIEGLNIFTIEKIKATATATISGRNELNDIDNVIKTLRKNQSFHNLTALNFRRSKARAVATIIVTNIGK